jgi:hypothetical protein
MWLASYPEGSLAFCQRRAICRVGTLRLLRLRWTTNDVAQLRLMNSTNAPHMAFSFPVPSDLLECYLFAIIVESSSERLFA